MHAHPPATASRHWFAEDPQRRARDEMALEVAGVVDGGVHGQKTLGGASRLEPLHFALSPSHRLMRILRPIVSSATVGRGEQCACIIAIYRERRFEIRG